MPRIQFIRKSYKCLFIILPRQGKKCARSIHIKLANRCTCQNSHKYKVKNIFAEHFENILRSLRKTTLNHKHEQGCSPIKNITMLEDICWDSLLLTSHILHYKSHPSPSSAPMILHKNQHLSIFNECQLLVAHYDIHD